MDQSNIKTDEADAQLKQAIEDLSENISIAGLKEAIAEPVSWIRRIFQVAVALCLVCAIYYTYGTVVEYVHRYYTDNIKIIADQESLPLSNVTVCADVTISKSFVKNNVTVPDALAARIAKAIGFTKTEFIEKYIEWISLTTVRRNVSIRFIKYFRLLKAANAQTSHHTAFVKSAMIQCRDMLKSCRFAGVLFDCCENAQTLVEDNGVCYQIAINHDVNSQHLSQATKRQSILGNAGGLTIEVGVDLDDVPWFADTASAGFKIYVHPTFVTPLQSPLTAPSEAETFIKVTAQERILNRNCLPLSSSPKVDGGGYYDPYGYVCITDKLQDAAYTVTECISPALHHSPNASVECNPEDIFRQTNLYLQGNENEIFGNSDGALAKAGRKLIAKIEKDVRSVSRFQRQCPPRCRYWEYSSTSSFVDLAKDNESAKNLLYSRVHIFYTDFLYQEKEEVLAVNVYLAFCNFGNVIGLYLGLSIVGVFEVIFWFAKFFIAFARFRRAKRLKPRPRTFARSRMRHVRRAKVTPL